MASDQMILPTADGPSSTTQFISVNLDELRQLKPRSQCRMRRAFVWIIGLMILAGAIGLVIGLISPSFNPSNSQMQGTDCV